MVLSEVRLSNQGTQRTKGACDALNLQTIVPRVQGTSFNFQPPSSPHLAPPPASPVVSYDALLHPARGIYGRARPALLKVNTHVFPYDLMFGLHNEHIQSSLKTGPARRLRSYKIV